MLGFIRDIMAATPAGRHASKARIAGNLQKRQVGSTIDRMVTARNIAEARVHRSQVLQRGSGALSNLSLPF